MSPERFTQTQTLEYDSAALDRIADDLAHHGFRAQSNEVREIARWAAKTAQRNRAIERAAQGSGGAAFRA